MLKLLNEHFKTIGQAETVDQIKDIAHQNKLETFYIEGGSLEQQRWRMAMELVDDEYINLVDKIETYYLQSTYVGSTYTAEKSKEDIIEFIKKTDLKPEQYFIIGVNGLGDAFEIHIEIQ